MAEASAAVARTGRSDPLRFNRTLGFGIALAIFVLDQAVKWIVTYILQLPDRLTINWLPFFQLNWVPNHGVSMGFLTANGEIQRWLLVGLTAAISIFVLAWLWREKRRDDGNGNAQSNGGEQCCCRRER